MEVIVNDVFSYTAKKSSDLNFSTDGRFVSNNPNRPEL
jgi:hypothetical protein